MLSGVLYLVSKNLKYDRIGHASAEIGTLFTGLVLTTGPIWATPIWGQPWVWEPRLITTLVLFLIYIIHNFNGLQFSLDCFFYSNGT